MTETQMEALREREEMRILMTVETVCRNHDVTMLVEVDPSPGSDDLTHVSIKYVYTRILRYRARRLSCFAFATAALLPLVPVAFPDTIVPSLLVGGVFGYFVIAAARARRAKPINPHILDRLIDAALIAAGFEVERTEDEWHVTIPAAEEAAE